MLASEEKSAPEKHDKRAVENGGSPPKPESVPVAAPLTVDDTVALDTSCQRKAEADDLSMVVNVDDTQSELDGDTSLTTPTVESKTKKDSSKSEDRKVRSESKKDSSKDKPEKDSKDSTAKESESKNSSKGKTRFVFKKR